MLYNPPTGGAANDAYVGANVAAGIQGSKIPPGAAEFPQRELVAIIAADPNQTPTNSDLAQALKAIRGGVLSYFSDTGGVNAPTIEVPIGYATLVDGLAVRVKMKNAPTGASNFFYNTLEAPIVRVGDVALVGNEWKAGDIVALVYSQARGAWQIAGLTPNDVIANLTATQILNVTGGVGFSVVQYYGSFNPQASNGGSHTLDYSFTAPAKGTVLAFSNLVFTAQPGLANFVTITVNGTQVATAGDSVGTSITDQTAYQVNKGDEVDVQSVVTASQATTYNCGQRLTLLFFPS